LILTCFIIGYRIFYKATNDNNEIEFVFVDWVGRELIGTPLTSLLCQGHPPAMPLSELIESVRREISIPRELLVVAS